MRRFLHNSCVRLGLLLAGLSALMLASANAGESDRSLRLTNGHWPPYVVDDNGDQGVVSRIVREAFAEVDIDVTFGFFPWSRAYQLARENHWDGAAAWSCLEDRYQDFYFSQPLLPVNTVFFHRKGRDFDWQSIGDIAGMVVAVTQDYSYYESLEPAIEDGRISVVISPTDYQNFRMLAEGRVDLFPMDVLAGSLMLEQEFSPERMRDIRFHPRSLRTEYLHLMLSRRDPANLERMEAFNRGLQALQDSDRIRPMLQTMLGAQTAAVLERMEPTSPSACASLVRLQPEHD